MQVIFIIIYLYVEEKKKKTLELLTELILETYEELAISFFIKKEKGWIGIFTNSCNPNLAA